MREFYTASIGFPTFFFTAALVIVIGFWLLVLFGAADADGFDGDVPLGALGLGGLPVTVAVSAVTVTGWFTGLAGTVVLNRLTGPGLVRALLSVVLLAVALLAAHQVTRLLARLWHSLRPHEPAPSRRDFIGQSCTIRTGRVDGGFGQAEVAVRDGSTAVVQVRQQDGEPPLTRGSTGLLYAYDDDGGFFWVTPQPLGAA
ncbi:OB-fold-containig protein [Streptomyces sp. TRM49041]|uniref:OB-fold-containig protein n=1 Tax=Streptomyces sp. TRM49041 TaxID=2603216 RepID=UPI0011EE3186|nr:OB-fold-containig protein [Streptomyces sp. TRM49041]